MITFYFMLFFRYFKIILLVNNCFILVNPILFSMWGSNCKDYIKESYRILDTCGTLLISEPYKRCNELDDEGKPINKFMFIVCRKN